MLIGSYEHSLDAKGRVFMPAKFRDELGSEIVLVNGIDKCIYAFSTEQWNVFSQKFTSLPITNQQAQKILRRLYASAIEREPDKQGRILLSSELKEHAKITDDVKIIGMSTRVEIWSKQEWEKYSNTGDEEFDEQTLAALAELGI